jgi:hypothetical protein
MLSDHAISRLSASQRSVLVDHVDGEVGVVVAAYRNLQARNSLIRIGLLRTAIPNAPRPRSTVLTEEGRRVLGAVLGEYADALVRAGLLDEENSLSPLQVLRELKSRHDGLALQGIVNTRGSSERPATETSAVKRQSRQTTE